MSKVQAQQKYDDAISKGSGAYLLEQDDVRSDVFQLSVGNLPAGKIAEISIHYITRVQVIDGNIRFTIPTTLAPTFKQSESKEEISDTPVSDYVSYSLDLEIAVDHTEIDAQKIVSPTHKIVTSQNGSVTLVTLTKKVPLDSDFVLTAPIIQKMIPVTLGYRFTSQTLRTVAADLEISPISITTASTTTIPIIIDLSGSMGGGTGVHKI